MKIRIIIEKKHFLIFSLFVITCIGSFFVIADDPVITIDDAWHPLQYIANDSTGMYSVDMDGDGLIDLADHADVVEKIEWSEIEGAPTGIKINTTTCAWTDHPPDWSGVCEKSCIDIGSDYVLVETWYSNNHGTMFCNCCQLVFTT